jgi:hypothetical protein
MLGRILHDEERRLIVRDVIMAPTSGTVSERQSVKQFVAPIKSLAQSHQIAFAPQLDIFFPPDSTRAAVAADQIQRADRSLRPIGMPRF